MSNIYTEPKKLLIILKKKYFANQDNVSFKLINESCRHSDDTYNYRYYYFKYIQSPLPPIQLKEQHKFSYVQINYLESDQTKAKEPKYALSYPSRGVKKTLPFMYVSRGCYYTIIKLIHPATLNYGFGTADGFKRSYYVLFHDNDREVGLFCKEDENTPDIIQILTNCTNYKKGMAYLGIK